MKGHLVESVWYEIKVYSIEQWLTMRYNFTERSFSGHLSKTDA